MDHDATDPRCPDELVELVRGARRVVFFGGAGTSTDSGIPDFRSAAGLYSQRRDDALAPEYLLSHSCLVERPEAFFAFHRSALLHPEARPNAGHRALARLEAAGRLTAVVTQNIDGLHQAAGSRVVHELHGSALRNHCTRCGAGRDMAWMLRTTGVPRCEQCGGMVRPDVVLYGEALDERVVDAAVRAIAASDLLLVGGTSLNVHPAAGLVGLRGGRLALVNLEATPQDHLADVVVHAGLGPVLTALADAVDAP